MDRQCSPTIGVAVITHTAKVHLPHCLPPLLNSPLRARVVVVNSSSNDGTVELAESLGAETLVIPRTEFNHGATRELARQHLGTDIVVMMTPDAYAADSSSLERLVAPLISGFAAVSYGRQVARHGADFFESYLRVFNYPATSHDRGIEDAAKYGAYTCFCSNAFAAYSNVALHAIGGFAPTLSHEDAVAVAKLLRLGYRVAYVADAVVTHSHPSSLSSEFSRYFDAGYSRRQFADCLSFAGNHGKLGRQYAFGLLRAAARQPWRLPYSVAHAATKWVGFRLGAMAVAWPPGLCGMLSGQEYYWKSRFFNAQSTAARSVRAGENQ